MFLFYSLMLPYYLLTNILFNFRLLSEQYRNLFGTVFWTFSVLFRNFIWTASGLISLYSPLYEQVFFSSLRTIGLTKTNNNQIKALIIKHKLLYSLYIPRLIFPSYALKHILCFSNIFWTVSELVRNCVGTFSILLRNFVWNVLGLISLQWASV